MGLYLFSGPAFEFPTHFGDDVSDSEGEALLDSLFCPIKPPETGGTFYIHVSVD